MTITVRSVPSPIQRARYFSYVQLLAAVCWCYKFTCKQDTKRVKQTPMTPITRITLMIQIILMTIIMTLSIPITLYFLEKTQNTSRQTPMTHWLGSVCYNCYCFHYFCNYSHTTTATLFLLLLLLRMFTTTNNQNK